MKPKSLSVCILYGWAEGSWHSRKLCQTLLAKGFAMSKNPTTASIIVSHSGGAFLIPPNIKAHLIIHVGLPYWPHRHPALNLPAKVIDEIRYHKNKKDILYKTFFNLIYISTKVRHNVRVWLGWKRFKNKINRECRVVVVRNQHDAFMHPEKSLELITVGAVGISLAGTVHDEIWFEPEAFVALISSFLKP